MGNPAHCCKSSGLMITKKTPVAIPAIRKDNHNMAINLYGSGIAFVLSQIFIVT